MNIVELDGDDVLDLSARGIEPASAIISLAVTIMTTTIGKRARLSRGRGRKNAGNQWHNRQRQ